MKQERQNIMPNEKAFEPINNNPPESPFDTEKIIQKLAKIRCEPTEGLYKRNTELKKDPFAAIKSVKLSGIREDEITDPITGLIIGAAKLETAKKELNLTPKQEKAVNGALIISLTLSAAGCVNVTESSVDANSNRTPAAATATINPTTAPTDLPPGVWTTPKPTELFTIGPTINPTEAITIPAIDVAPYPRTDNNFITTPSISGNAAEKRIIELGAGGDLGLLKTMYRQGGLNDTKITFEPVILENEGKVFWNVMARAQDGHFYKFVIKSDTQDDQVVRAMGMITFINTKPVFSVEELANPKGFEGASQKVIWDKNGWSVIGAFEGGKLVAWFNADARDGGKWETIVVPEDTPTPTETPTPEYEMITFTNSNGETITMPKFADADSAFKYIHEHAVWHTGGGDLDSRKATVNDWLKLSPVNKDLLDKYKLLPGWAPIYAGSEPKFTDTYLIYFVGKLQQGSLIIYEKMGEKFESIFIDISYKYFDPHIGVNYPTPQP